MDPTNTPRNPWNPWKINWILPLNDHTTEICHTLVGGGGCEEWKSLNLKRHRDVFSLDQCQQLCTGHASCASFTFGRGESWGKCNLFRKGCSLRKSQSQKWTLYHVETCSEYIEYALKTGIQ